METEDNLKTTDMPAISKLNKKTSLNQQYVQNVINWHFKKCVRMKYKSMSMNLKLEQYIKNMILQKPSFGLL